ncbi:hypothetical protein KCP78_09890 [Salmonella enterica subsp. enterica]|nr:hypothetical protein KCP78_09890 [Salmonella enterica subsp. enterica]
MNNVTGFYRRLAGEWRHDVLLPALKPARRHQRRRSKSLIDCGSKLAKEPGAEGCFLMAVQDIHGVRRAAGANASYQYTLLCLTLWRRFARGGPKIRKALSACRNWRL